MSVPVFPQVSVIMPVFNGATYLRESIESILNQTFRNFEFLIVDDGSRDESGSIVTSYRDQRIKFIKNDSNLGLSASLNRCLELARGTYIARMDADDLSLPNRFERQVCFMEQHLHVDVSGSWVEAFDGKRKTVWSAPLNDDEIKSCLLFSPPMYHPTVIFRKKLFDDTAIRYSTNFAQAQDYELWCRLMECCTFANLDSVLLRYRLHAQSVSQSAADGQLLYSVMVRKWILQRLGFEPTEQELNLHNTLASCQIQPERDVLEQAHNWLLRIQSANRERQVLPQQALATVLARRWHEVCVLSTALGMDVCRMYYCSPFSAALKLPLHHHAAFFLRALLHKPSGKG